MRGASRDSLATLQEELRQAAAGAGGADLSELSAQLLAVAGLLGREHALRGSLTDPSAAPESRSALVTTLLRDRVGPAALALVERGAASRWSSPRDLTDALETIGAQAAFLDAERSGTLDAVEDELFRFGRAVQAQPQLRSLLDDSSLAADRKVAVLRDLLGGRVAPVTLALLEHVARNPRGRRTEDAVEDLVALAAERSQEVLAEVRVAAPLEPEQERRMADALRRIYRRAVRMHVAVDPTVLGGAVLRVGDEVIDGSVASRLEEARRRLTG